MERSLVSFLVNLEVLRVSRPMNAALDITGNNQTACFLGFSKAFDRINHNMRRSLLRNSSTLAYGGLFEDSVQLPGNVSSFALLSPNGFPSTPESHKAKLGLQLYLVMVNQLMLTSLRRLY